MNDDDDDVNDDDGSVQTHDRLRERFHHMPVEVADRVFARTAARVDAALRSDDILRFGQLNVDSNRCFATPTTDDASCDVHDDARKKTRKTTTTTTTTKRKRKTQKRKENSRNSCRR